MTLSELESIDREYLLVDEVAEFLDAAPQTIRIQAQHEPEKLGFPVVVCGNRVKIPKDGFLYFCRYGRPTFSGEISVDAIKFFIDQAINGDYNKK